MHFMIGLRVARQFHFWLGVVGMLLTQGSSHAGISLECDRRQYGVAAGSSQEIEVPILIDGDDTAPGLQPVPHGLFSYGFLLRFDSAILQPLPGNAVSVDPALDFFGFAGGAKVTAGTGFVAIKGNINPLGSPWVGNQMATVRLRFQTTPPPSTPLTLEIYQQTPNESVFVDGVGTAIDSQIVPRPSLIVRLDPPQVQWLPGPPPHARITFQVPPGADVVLQWSRTMAAGDWQDLPGAPHNSGEYLDFAPADRRFYRLTLLDR